MNHDLLEREREREWKSEYSSPWKNILENDRNPPGGCRWYRYTNSIRLENDSQEKKSVATDNFRENIFPDSQKENNSVNTEENNLKETLNSILSNVPIISNSGKKIDSDAPKQEDEDINEKLDNENLKTESVSQKNPLDDDPLFN